MWTVAESSNLQDVLENNAVRKTQCRSFTIDVGLLINKWLDYKKPLVCIDPNQKKHTCLLVLSVDAVPDGQTPQNVTLCMYDELVDVAKPGDR